MDLKEAILHRIEKTAGRNAVVLDPKSECLPVDNRLNKLADDVLTIYGKACNGYGTFDPDEAAYTFPIHLKRYKDEADDLVEFSKSTLSLIGKEMESSNFATGGFVLFLRYENQGADWLLIVMLKLKAGTGVDLTTKELVDALSLDVDHLHEAARVNFGKWLADDQPYLSFVKKSSGGNDVTKYFRLALGCTEYVDSKHNTKEMMRAVDDFCVDKNWTAEQKTNARRVVYEYCAEKTQNGEPVNITALSAHILDQEPEEFVRFLCEGDYTVSDNFDPHPATYKRYHRVNGKMGSVSVAFDVDDLVSGNIVYSSEDHTLTIGNLTQKLEADILRALGNDITE